MNGQYGSSSNANGGQNMNQPHSAGYQQAQNYGEPAAYGAQPGYGHQPEPPKKNWVPAAIISAVVAVLLIGGGIFAYFAFFNKSEDNKADNQHNQQKHDDKQPQPAPAPAPAPSPNPGPNPNSNSNPAPNPTKKLDPNSSFCKNLEKNTQNLYAISAKKPEDVPSSSYREIANLADRLSKSKEASKPEVYAYYAKLMRGMERIKSGKQMSDKEKEEINRLALSVDREAINTDAANCGLQPHR
ncbi:MAG: hypothetical protein Q4C71_06080 [Microbacteriaceae bacterium]|nr:hypothetical protein [Microbacteriaceae bacterium]